MSAADGDWNERDKSRRTFRGEWTHTGDTYIRDSAGLLPLLRAQRRHAEIGGVWVSPFEVEEALIGPSSGARSCLWSGHPTREGLIKPKAFVVLQENVRVEDGCRSCARNCRPTSKNRIGAWKYPRWIEFADSLPKTATGKIQRFKLRDGAS